MKPVRGLGEKALSRISNLRKTAQQYQEISKEDEETYGGNLFTDDEERLDKAISSGDIDAVMTMLESGGLSAEDLRSGRQFALLSDQPEIADLLGQQSVKTKKTPYSRFEWDKASAKKAQEEGGYQGWTNYVTWAVALWMDNDAGNYEYWRDRINEIKEEGDYGGRGSNEFMTELTDDEKLLPALADEMKDMHEMLAEEANLQGVLSDLLNGALSEVDWRSIAENTLSSYSK
jgi:hypothetical protein